MLAFKFCITNGPGPFPSSCELRTCVNDVGCWGRPHFRPPPTSHVARRRKPGSDLLLACCSFPYCRNFISTRFAWGVKWHCYFPFLAGPDLFFVSFCYLYFCFRFVFAPYFILPTNRPTTEPPDILAKLVFCFRILLWCPSTWHLEFGRVGPLAAPRLLCAVSLFAEKRFIYLFMFRKDQQRKKGPPWKYFSARI